MALEHGRPHPRRDERGNIRRKAPTWEQAGPELRREWQTCKVQQSLPSALPKPDQDGSLIEVTCEYSSELQYREIRFFDPARYWTSLKPVPLPNASWAGRHIHRIAVQCDCCRPIQRSAIQRRPGGKRDGCVSHNGSLK